jgi:hypothetical protein
MALLCRFGVDVVASITKLVLLDSLAAVLTAEDDGAKLGDTLILLWIEDPSSSESAKIIT